MSGCVWSLRPACGQAAFLRIGPHALPLFRYQLRLRELEDELLAALNAVEGNILEDEVVIPTMERLKTEANAISAQIEETTSG